MVIAAHINEWSVNRGTLLATPCSFSKNTLIMLMKSSENVAVVTAMQNECLSDFVNILSIERQNR